MSSSSSLHLPPLPTVLHQTKLSPKPTTIPKLHPSPTPKLSTITNKTHLPICRREATLSLASLLVASLLPNPSLASECSLVVAPSGLAYCDQVVGYGPEAAKGQLIKAHYVGRLENGKVFDSSYGRGKPLTFRIGVGEVIKGWDQGILGGDGIPPMLTGGKRTLKLPPELGYGVRGAGCRGGSCIIPPDSTLLFDVEFIGKA
ncbi:uncharacterized protein A4U43_C08F24720 [Asparagus officinalis]|uniref:peptidyl-prolyl cis-trans isomerase FKBP13, chloroplastic-like n=1 Tax=Asparagus officinalis TaxID=4686 RepID=UPI00098E40B9|nr:peptidyl-prolyl cis-trans isomerase FKBP13, chloroplastic-like [Asparagus officinalis]ONK60978.1 uncharacterized protein A4U43_C08F24720 [Asparagus officinalis]